MRSHHRTRDEVGAMDGGSARCFSGTANSCAPVVDLTFHPIDETELACILENRAYCEMAANFSREDCLFVESRWQINFLATWGSLVC